MRHGFLALRWIALGLLPLLYVSCSRPRKASAAFTPSRSSSPPTAAASPEIRARIDQQLGKSQLQVVNNAASADAILRLTANVWATGTVSASPRSNSTRATNYQGYLSAELTGKDNQTLWSYLVTPNRLRTESFTDDLADQLVSRLLAAIRSGIPNPAGSFCDRIGCPCCLACRRRNPSRAALSQVV